MTDKIVLGVKASFDASEAKAGMKDLESTLNSAGSTKPFDPVSDASVKRAEKINSAFREYLKIDAEVARRRKVTGQEKASFQETNWATVIPNDKARQAKLMQMRAFIKNRVDIDPIAAGAPASEPGPQQPAQGPNHGPVANGAARVAQAGLRAAGPTGGVAASALGTGMSAGFGAGLAGLVGGMLAQGVGKVVGDISDRIGQAEDNAVAMDKLKRTLGDVNVSFNALKAAVHGGADAVRLTYAQAEGLASTFVKAGNLEGKDFRNLGEELEINTGTARAFGMEPEQVNGVMGQMRGLGVTSNTQESRRFALLIGETIGKSGAFSKADEVMEAIASYASSQTRKATVGANVEGYAGMFAGMAGAKIPGLDPQGVASLLSRVNSSLSNGGAAGEASQFFTGQVGAKMGLDPIQTQILREGGAFATTNQMFGKGSAAEQFGIEAPQTSDTLLQKTLEMLKDKYKDNKGFLAQATSRHLGIGINEAMRLLSVEPQKIGEMQQFGDLSKVSASGFGNLTKAVTGTAEDRQSLANEMTSRTDVSLEDKTAIGEKRGDDVGLKQLLGELSVKYGQERTQGSDIRDSKNALDNIKTSIASTLIPLTNQIHLGIVHIAGEGKKSPAEIMAKVLGLESADRESQIRADAKNARSGAFAGLNKTTEEKKQILEDLKKNYNTMTPDERKAAQEKVTRLTTKEFEEEEAAKKKIIQLREDEVQALKKEQEALAKRIEESKKAVIEDAKPPVIPGVTPVATTGDFARFDRRPRDSAGAPPVAPPVASGAPRGTVAPSGGSGGTGAGSAALGGGTTALASTLDEIKDPEQRKNAAAFLGVISESEGAGYNTLVGHGKNNNKVSDLSKHPNIVGMRTADGPSTAAGAYQITGTTYRDVAPKLGISDFTPESQDKIAIALIKRRGAWPDVLAGRWDDAAKKLGGEWQSLPTGTSPNQGKHSWGNFRQMINRALEKQNGAASNKVVPVEKGAPLPDLTPPKPPELPEKTTDSKPGAETPKLPEKSPEKAPELPGKPPVKPPELPTKDAPKTSPLPDQNPGKSGYMPERTASAGGGTPIPKDTPGAASTPASRLTPMPEDVTSRISNERAQQQNVAMSGSVAVQLELSELASKFLKPPAAPISTRVDSNWRAHA